MSLDEFTYILVDRRPVQHRNDDEWFRWYQNVENRRVALTRIDDVTVSTVFDGIDIRPQRGMLFETKIFGGAHDQKEWLAATWEEAEQCHAKAVALVQQ